MYGVGRETEEYRGMAAEDRLKTADKEGLSLFSGRKLFCIFFRFNPKNDCQEANSML